MMVFGEPGTQGVRTGTQGIGVSTPSAAAVAEATSGLDSDMHIPKVGMLTISLSMIVPAGMPSIITIVSGSTISEAGAAPKVHMHKALETAAGSPTGSAFVLARGAHAGVRHRFEPFTDSVSLSPVVVTMQVTVRSPDAQLRTEGSR